LHFSAFHPDYRMRDIAATPPATLTRARGIARGNGLHHVYTGNVSDSAGQSTYCAGCGEMLIGRDWYKLGAWNLDAHASCRNCGTVCLGVFEAQAGTWGARRQPVSLGA